MEAYRINSPVTTIVKESFKITCANLKNLFTYLLYPIFGQVLGLAICLLPPITVITRPELQGNINVALGVIFVVILGLILFCNAFWKYLLCMGGMVLIGKKIIDGEEVGDFKRYTTMFEQRSREYIAYLLQIALIWFLLIPLCLIITVLISGFTSDLRGSAVLAIGITSIVAIFVAIFLDVALQSFVLNPRLAPFQTIKKGAALISKNFASNLGCMLLIGLVTFGVSFVAELPFDILQGFTGSQIFSAISGLVSFFLTSFLLAPFAIFCKTWWYSRMAGYNTPPVKQ